MKRASLPGDSNSLLEEKHGQLCSDCGGSCMPVPQCITQWNYMFMGWASISAVFLHPEERPNTECPTYHLNHLPENLLNYVNCLLIFLMLCVSVLHELFCQIVNPCDVFFYHTFTIITCLTSRRGDAALLYDVHDRLLMGLCDDLTTRR